MLDEVIEYYINNYNNDIEIFDGEEFVDIFEYEGLYQISTHGRVWGIKKQKFLTSQISDSGHLYFELYKNNIKTKKYIHRLILETFVGPCPIGKECRHLDDDPTNNKLENLCWGTRSENLMDRVVNGKGNQGERHLKAILTEDEVDEIRDLYGTDSWTSRSLAEKFDVSHGTIQAIVHRRSWNHI